MTGISKCVVLIGKKSLSYQGFVFVLECCSVRFLLQYEAHSSD
jgi:hypothetical protein